MIPPVLRRRYPNITGPAMDVTFPTPSAMPKPVARYWVGNSSGVYAYTAPHAPRLKKLTRSRLARTTAKLEAVAKR